MIAIKIASEDDAEALSRILISSIQKLCVADHKNEPALIARWTANKTPSSLIGWISNPQISLFLAKRSGTPAGVGCVSNRGGILLNYVDPTLRFCGVSRALLVHMEQVLAAQGVEMGKLTSTETAHAFYQRAGWHDAGEPEVVNGMTGYRMEKTLINNIP